MTDVFTPPALSTLVSQGAPIAVVADNDVVSLSVSYGPFQSTETVWQQGVFMYPFLRSTKTGARTFSVVRDGGWPSAPGFWCNDPPAGGVAAADLQPANYSPYAAWSLLREDIVGAVFPDRSGNGHNSATVAAAQPWGPDLIAPKAGPLFGEIPTNPFGISFPTVGDYTGDLTIIARMFRSRLSADVGTDQYAVLSTYTGSTGTVFIGWDASDVLFYGSGQFGYANSTFNVPTGKDAMQSIRRPAAGTVRFGLNDAFETAACAAPVAISGAVLRVGSTNWGGAFSYPLHGGVVDVMVWRSLLTDAEVIAQNAIALPVALR